MAKTGRPRIEIDQEQFRKLCEMQCTEEEIAGFFDCSADTIERWCKRELNASFAEIFKKWGAVGKISVRRNAFHLSEKNAAVCIFLCKNYLGMRDNPEIVETERNELLESLARMERKLSND